MQSPDDFSLYLSFVFFVRKNAVLYATGDDANQVVPFPLKVFEHVSRGNSKGNFGNGRARNRRSREGCVRSRTSFGQVDSGQAIDHTSCLSFLDGTQ